MIQLDFPCIELELAMQINNYLDRQQRDNEENGEDDAVDDDGGANEDNVPAAEQK